MKYYDLKRQLEALVVFSPLDIRLIDSDFRQATLYDWEKTGQVVRLRNNRYVFGDVVPENYDYYLLSNLIYEPSYVSTELALNHYGLIPEAVMVVSAVTTSKTQCFTALQTTFSYQSIRPDLYFGYELIEVRNHGVKLASLEKAILDYLYLNSDVVSVTDFVSLRWNRQILRDEVDSAKLSKYLALFSNQALNHRVALLKDYLKENYTHA